MLKRILTLGFVIVQVAFLSVACSAAPSSTSAVQGAGEASPLQGQTVTVEGVVTGDFQGAQALRGFFIQDPTGDGDAATSDGLFVYVLAKNKLSQVDVAAGDRVRISGMVREYRGLTQLDDITALDKLGRAPLPAPVAVELPLDEAARERFEGMLVTFPQTLTVDGNENLRKYGELTLSQGGRLFAPTNGQGDTVEGNARRRVLLDDGSIRRPPTTPYFSNQGTRRVGDTVQGLTGVLTFTHNAFRVHPTTAPIFTLANPRPAKPTPVGGTLRVASFNIENYFTTLKTQSKTARGAATPEEFARKTTRLVAALRVLDADILGLIEVENNGSKTVDYLVAQLNAAMGVGTYAAVADPPGGAGTDVIKVALLYKPAKVEPVGAAASLVQALFERYPVAQTFQTIATPGARFTVVMNHFKSKSGAPKTGDLDAGQGAWNLKRTAQAHALAGFVRELQARSGDKDVLVLGDLNAYAEEDPLKVLESAGLQSLEKRLPANERYSYVYAGQSGSLDHALATPSLLSQVTGATIWHINADEPRDKGATLASDESQAEDDKTGNATPDDSGADTKEATAPLFGVSDHDPLIIGLKPDVSSSVDTATQPAAEIQALAEATNASAAVSASRTPHASLNATLWLQTSVEAQGAAQQAYKLAALRLDQALRSPTWTASLEQAGAAQKYVKLPPAVILDIDETILSNAPFDAWSVLHDKAFDEATWRRWTEAARAAAVPGALGFARYAQSKGVAVFYISNRSKAEEVGTAKNLRALGFPLSTRFDSILSRDEKPGWGSDKTTRRRVVAGTHRILLLMGDDLNDFVSGAKAGLQQRSALQKHYGSYWGEKWIVLPNPVYGSWEGALTSASGNAGLTAKYELLEAVQSPLTAVENAPTPSRRIPPQ